MKVKIKVKNIISIVFKTSMHNVTIHEVLLGGAAKIFENFIKGNQYCLLLASKSAPGYDEIRYDANKGNGFVILPSRRRLRNNKNYIKPQRGFNQGNIGELCSKIKDFSEQKKLVVMLMDEMKIQENLE